MLTPTNSKPSDQSVLNNKGDHTVIDLTNHNPISTTANSREELSLSSFHNIGSEAILRLHPPTMQTMWTPTQLQPLTNNLHPMASLMTNSDKILLKDYCQLQPQTIILRLSRRPNITLITSDMQTLSTPGTQIHQEQLIFGLENAWKIYGSSYLEPAFFPILQQHGWKDVINWLSPANTSEFSPNCQHPNIFIPIHINGNHWIAVNRRIIEGRVRFLYANDLNNKTTEGIVKRILFENAPLGFCPPGSLWITCSNTTYRPHSNECGPRATLALTVLMSHPRPHKNLLQPYMHSNLAMTA